MAKFRYKAKNRRSEIVQGEISAKSKKAAETLLSNRGLTVKKIIVIEDAEQDIVEKKGFIYRDGNGKIQFRLGSNIPSSKELALFTKQLSLMIENGIPLLQALTLMADQTRRAGFKEAIERTRRKIETGSTFTDALEGEPHIFDKLFTAMINAGESSGRLDIILRQLTTYIEKNAKLKAQVKAAMVYPALVLFVAVAVVVVLLVYVVPSFAKQFRENGQELPTLTLFVIELSESMTQNWMVWLGSLAASLILFRYYVKSNSGRAVIDRYILKAPIFGDVMSKIAVGRFCSTLSTMISSGVPIIESLEICATASGNRTIESFIRNVKEEITRGSTFADPLSEGGLMPKMVVSMVTVGETTGTLDETLRKVSEIYDDEVDTAVAAMMSMIEPLMIVGIGAAVGFIVIAMYLPIFGMAGTV